MYNKKYANYSKEVDNVETEKLIPIFTSFLKQIDAELPGDSYRVSIEELEYKSRDGFLASQHNRGGMDFLDIMPVTDVYYGNVPAPKYIVTRVTCYIEKQIETIKQEMPHLNEEEVSETFYTEQNKYDDIARRVRIMYEGQNTVVIHVGWDDDAPYFRWHGSAESIVIKYKNRTELKKKLAAKVKTVINILDRGVK